MFNKSWWFLNFQKEFLNFSFCIRKLAVAFYMINEIQPKIKFQNIVQCPFKSSTVDVWNSNGIAQCYLHFIKLLIDIFITFIVLHQLCYQSSIGKGEKFLRLKQNKNVASKNMPRIRPRMPCYATISHKLSFGVLFHHSVAMASMFLLNRGAFSHNCT